MDTRCAWVLNLDAELELETPNGYQPSATTRRAVQSQIPRLAGLLRPDDVIVWPGDVERVKPALSGHCWCSTPSALRRLRRAGASIPPQPPFEAVRSGNHRRLQERIDVRLPGATYVTTAQELERALSMRAPCGVLCKRPYSFASRNARRLSPTRTPAQVDDDDGWLRASLAAGGLWVEPWVEVVAELSLHGVVAPDGAHGYGAICRSFVEPKLGWRSARLATTQDVSASDAERMHAAARDTAAALLTVGYFGPFGIDALLWRNEDGRVALHPLSDVNARYTMGWALGISAAKGSRDDDTTRVPT